MFARVLTLILLLVITADLVFAAATNEAFRSGLLNYAIITGSCAFVIIAFYCYRQHRFLAKLISFSRSQNLPIPIKVQQMRRYGHGVSSGYTHIIKLIYAEILSENEKSSIIEKAKNIGISHDKYEYSPKNLHVPDTGSALLFLANKDFRKKL